MLAKQIAAPNSPQWFNTGLFCGLWHQGARIWSMGGRLRRDPQAQRQLVFQTNSSYQYPQPHACFIQPVADDLVNPDDISICGPAKVRLFKHGSGPGPTSRPSAMNAKSCLAAMSIAA